MRLSEFTPSYKEKSTRTFDTIDQVANAVAQEMLYLPCPINLQNGYSIKTADRESYLFAPNDERTSLTLTHLTLWNKQGISEIEFSKFSDKVQETYKRLVKSSKINYDSITTRKPLPAMKKKSQNKK